LLLSSSDQFSAILWQDQKIWFMVFNATCNNISVISWWPVLMVEKTSDLSQVIDELYHLLLY